MSADVGCLERQGDWEGLKERAQALGAKDLGGSLLILRDGLKAGLSGSELMLLQDEIAAITRLRKDVVAQLLIEAQHYVEGRGIVSDYDAAARAYGDKLLQRYVKVVYTEGSFYGYAALNPALDGHEDCGFYAEFQHSEILQDMTVDFPNHPLFRTEMQRREVLKRLQHAYERPDFFADAASGLTCENGFVTMSNGELTLVESRLEQKARFRSRVNFNKTATCPFFLDSLVRILPDESRRLALQEMLGAIVFDVSPARDRARRLLLLDGATRSGKSSLVDVLELLLPSTVICSVSPADWTKPFERARLKGARLNTCTELGDKAVLASDRFKQIVSCESVSARLPYGQPFQFRPTARHVVATNTLPRVDDRTRAFERRMLVVRFDRSLGVDEVDGKFLERVAEELPGVLAWLARGAERLASNQTFTLPDGHEEAICDILYGKDPVARFALTQVERCPGGRVTSGEIRVAMEAWARENDFDPAAIGRPDQLRRFAAIVRAEHGGERSRSNNPPCYHGIRLRDPDRITRGASEL